ISRLRPSTPRSVDVCEATSITSASAATSRVCCVSSKRRSGRGTSGCAVAANANVLTGRGLRISSDRCLSPAHGSRSGSGVGSHKSHQRQSRMVEISLSGSGEGPGWVTSRPTLQATFHVTPAPASPRTALPPAAPHTSDGRAREATSPAAAAHHAGGKRRAASSARRRQGLRAGGGCWTAGAAEGGGLLKRQMLKKEGGLLKRYPLCGTHFRFIRSEVTHVQGV